MDVWSKKEYKLNLFLAGALLVLGGVLFMAAKNESVHQDYALTMRKIGMVLSGLAVAWGFGAAFKWTLQS